MHHTIKSHESKQSFLNIKALDIIIIYFFSKTESAPLKNLPPNTTDFLTEIFNHALSAGCFPNPYKHTTLTLIPKAGTSDTTAKGDFGCQKSIIL